MGKEGALDFARGYGGEANYLADRNLLNAAEVIAAAGESYGRGQERIYDDIKRVAENDLLPGIEGMGINEALNGPALYKGLAAKTLIPEKLRSVALR